MLPSLPSSSSLLVVYNSALQGALHLAESNGKCVEMSDSDLISEKLTKMTVVTAAVAVTSKCACDLFLNQWIIPFYSGL